MMFLSSFHSLYSLDIVWVPARLSPVATVKCLWSHSQSGQENSRALLFTTGVIPKSVRTQHIKDNICVQDFELTAEDMDALNQMNSDTRFCWDPTRVK